MSFALWFILIFGSAIPASAQSAGGTISGQVTDQQNAVIAGADVKIVDTSTNSTRSTVTNDVGRYTFATVAPGVYNLTVSKTGFQASRVNAQKVDVGQVLTINVALQLGATSTTVEVQASAGAELQTLNATVGSTIENDALVQMPNLGRDASVLSTIQVGVVSSGQVAGASADQNTFQLDGGYNTDDMAGNNSSYVPANGYFGTGASGGTPSGVVPTPVESIEEIKIGTSQQTADFNSAAGSQVQMVTKRGTNAFHGALYEYYFASNVGAANLWQNNRVGQPLPSAHRNRFGVAVGGPLTPKFWGGKTYWFVNYEAMRFDNVTTFERATPSALLRAGVVQIPNSAGVVTPYNLNTAPVTVNGVTYQPAQCVSGGASGACDPRMLGMNPYVQKLWNSMPLPNDPSFTTGPFSDGYNAAGFIGGVALPQTSNFFVGRLDHDFGEKWKFFSSYRYYSFAQETTAQTLMTSTGYNALSTRPFKPSYIVGGLTTTISPNLTNDFRVSYLRNWWQWGDIAGPPQFAALGGVLEPGGESTYALAPYNVNSQSTRQRFWDGQDQNYRDDISFLHGNHLFQFGGSWLRNFDYHERNDNGVGIDTSITYQMTNGVGIPSSAYPTPGIQANQASLYDGLYSAVLGIVSQSQVMYTRSGSQLTLNPLGTPGFDQSIMETYNTYFTDTWHMRPTFTLTYGLGYQLALPPYEINGKQVMLVDQAGLPVTTADYLKNKQIAALAGQSYDPLMGFADLRNVGTGLKYPYHTFYGGFSPHLSLAWSPNFTSGMMGKVFGSGKTVIRGGYARIYGRLNGVELVLVPLLGPGPLQAVSCFGLSNGQCAPQGGVTPQSAFRIGTDGNAAPLPAVSQTFPQPYYPGINGNATASDGSLLDPNYRPSVSDEFNFTIQRALSNKASVEFGYIGRKIGNVFQQINIDPVPYMYTLNGQSFATAYSNMYRELCGLSGPICANTPNNVGAQPFIEAALGGSTSGFCAGYASCTQALIQKNGSLIKNTQVYSLWQAMSQAPGWTLGRTLISSPAVGGTNINPQITAMELDTSLGWGNYNAAFIKFTTRNWNGLTLSSNFTWSRALGTGNFVSATSSATVTDAFNIGNAYGPQPFDAPISYNLLLLYQVPYFKNQKGIVGHLLGGWSIAPLFTAQSGFPQEINVGTGANTDAQAFGEVYGNNNSSNENAVAVAPYTGGNSSHYNVQINTSSGVGTSGKTGVNEFANPTAIFNEFRPPVLGTDFQVGSAGVLRGFPTWNLDATLTKDIAIRESIGAQFFFQAVNVLNHFQPLTPNLNINSPQTWGVVTQQALSANGLGARALEFGLRIHF
jgi:hypothetical protein